jgi:hypothetical protein
LDWFETAGKVWETHLTPLYYWAIIYYGRIRSCYGVHAYEVGILN